MNVLNKIISTQKSGNEKLLFNKTELPFSLIDFWRWNMSDLMSNATRGKLAEFIVATAIGMEVNTVRG